MLNRIIAGILPILPKRFIWLFSKRYIAGERMEDAIRVSKKLNHEGMVVTLDLLGEFQTRVDRIDYYKAQYLMAIDSAADAGLNATFSLKPTMFGLLLDMEMCYRHIRDILLKAYEYGRMVRIDMEDSKCTDREIELFKRLYREFPGYIGLALQSYLRRTMNDLAELNKISVDRFPVNIRLCKGIYNESEQIAYKTRGEINHCFIEGLDFMLRNGFYTAIATHDSELTNKAYELINKYIIHPDRYEFQMLYGVTPELRRKIVADGHRMRVYVPFGTDWFSYSVRRLKENPRIVTHIVKALIFRN